MNRTMENIFLEIEQLLNARALKEKEKKELIKDIQDFENLYPEVGKVIEELEAKAKETNQESVKQELDSYLKERLLYEQTIQEFVKRLQNVRKELEDMPDLSGKVVEYLYSYRETKKELRYLESRVSSFSDKQIVTVLNEFDEEVSILKEDQKEYLEHVETIKNLENTIRNIYESYILEDDFDLAEENIVLDEEVSVAKNTFEELQEKRNEILKELEKLENAKGRKCHYVFSYNGVKQAKDIPRKVRGKYGSLLTQLQKIEKQMDHVLPDIRMDMLLYDQMSVEQKRQYLANLLLQIEAYQDQSFNKFYINGKYIPYAYKDLYQEIYTTMKNLNNKRDSYYSYTFDHPTYRTLSNERKFEYVSSLMEKLVSNYKVEPTKVVFNGKSYEVNKNDVPLFQLCADELVKIKGLLDEEVTALESSLQNYCIDNNEMIEVTLNNQTKKIAKEKVNEFIKEKARYQNLLEKKEEIDAVTFDQAYYDVLSEEKKVKYCKGILNEILLREKKNPVQLYLDGQLVTIDARYTKAFTMATSKLVEKKYGLDISIDEKRVSQYNDVEKRAYYRLLLDDICEKPIHEKVVKIVNNKTYSFDKKYESLFDEVVNRYQDLKENSKKKSFVTKIRKAKNLEKIKKAIKTRAVQIAFGATALVAVFAMGNRLSHQEEKVVMETLSETTTNDDIMNTSNEQKEEIENKVENTQKESLSTLGSVYTLDDTTPIYENRDLTTPLTPKYDTDSYTVVKEHYVMPDQTIETVDYQDENAEEKIAEIKANGGVLQSVSGVAQSAEDHYLENNIPTGVFKTDTIDFQKNLETELSNIVNDNLGGRSR